MMRGERSYYDQVREGLTSLGKSAASIASRAGSSLNIAERVRRAREANAEAKRQANLPATEERTFRRVLPGQSCLHGALLEAFSSRSLKRTGRSAAGPSSSNRSLITNPEEKQLAVVQHESLLLFRSLPFEVPAGMTTKEAIREAKAEIGEALLEISCQVRLMRMTRAAELRRAFNVSLTTGCER